MFEVAKLAGVSHQTVSRVINHSPDVSDATREKVQRAIDQLGLPSQQLRPRARLAPVPHHRPDRRRPAFLWPDLHDFRD